MTSAPMTSAPMTGPAGAASRSVTSRWMAAVAGAVSAALALGVSELIAGLLPGATSLVAAVGQVVIDLQPAGAKDLVVALFGTNDKLALEVVVVLASLAFGALLGIIATRSFVAAAIGFAAFGVVGFVAALGDPLAIPTMVTVQIAISVGLGVQVLSWLMTNAAAATPTVAPAGSPGSSRSDPARRSFLLRSGAVGLGAARRGGRRACSAGTVPSGPFGRRGLHPARHGHRGGPPDRHRPRTRHAGLTPIVMPNDQFYRIDTALLTPTVDVAGWTLRIHGLVDRETILTWDELLGLPMFEQYVTIACVSNEVGGKLVGNAKWTGIRLRDVLEIAGVQSGATQLVGRSVDGWTAGMPTAWVMDPGREPMIAVKMNDEPLPPAHGFPARLIVPGLYGYVSATKWLAELELTTLEAFDGYWVPLGWAKEAPILTQSRIDTPRGSVQAGRVPIAGIAWAPDRGISRVEVAVDDTWVDATLSRPISDATWVQWVLPWDATAGRHTIRVRATDGQGAVQEERVTPPAPDGARGWDAVTVTVA